LLKDMRQVQYEKPCHFCSYIDAWRGYIWSMLPHPPQPKRRDEAAPQIQAETQPAAEVVELRTAQSPDEPRRARSRR
jgi:hypothetical protein